MAITTKPISVKLEFHVLDELDLEVKASGIPRNKIINLACLEYCKSRDAERLSKCIGG